MDAADVEAADNYRRPHPYDLIHDIIDDDHAGGDDDKEEEDKTTTAQDKKVDTIIHLMVPAGSKNYFDDWLVRIYEVLITFKGFISRYVYQVAVKDGYIEYAVVLVFDSQLSQKAWMESTERMEKIDEIATRGIKHQAITAYGTNVSGSSDSIPHEGSTAAAASASSHSHISSVHKRINIHDSMLTIPRPLPPAKWKLTVILITLVFIVLLVIHYGGSIQMMLAKGLPSGLVTFISLIHIVIFLIYSLLPLTISIPVVNQWLRIPRPPPDEMNPIESVLDQGLKLFANRTEVGMPPEMLKRIDRLEANLDKLRSVNYELNMQLKSSISNLIPPNTASVTTMIPVTTTSTGDRQSDSIVKEIDKQAAANMMKQEPITLVVRHFVKWEFIPDFESWTDEMDREMQRWEGYIGMVRIAPKHDEDSFINCTSWDSYSHLQAFSQSTERAILLSKLEPMLEGTSQAQVGEERVFRDAFSELFVATGDTVAKRPPSLWKTTILAIIPLFIIVWSVGGNLQPYLNKDDSQMSRVLQTFILTIIDVTINSYVGVPLMVSHPVAHICIVYIVVVHTHHQHHHIEFSFATITTTNLFHTIMNGVD